MFGVTMLEKKHEYGNEPWAIVQIEGRSYELIVREYDDTCGMQKFYLRDMKTGKEVYYYDGIADVDGTRLQLSHTNMYDEVLYDAIELHMEPDAYSDWVLGFTEL